MQEVEQRRSSCREGWGEGINKGFCPKNLLSFLKGPELLQVVPDFPVSETGSPDFAALHPGYLFIKSDA